MQCQGLGEGGLEASASSGISSVHLFTLHSGNWCFFSFQVVLLKLERTLLRPGAGTSHCNHEY